MSKNMWTKVLGRVDDWLRKCGLMLKEVWTKE